MYNLTRRLSTLLSLLLFTSSLWLLCSCTPIDLYEKQVPLPEQQWKSSYKPQFTFAITDTTSVYQLYILLRHTNRYRFNNIWVNLAGQAPADTVRKVGLELPLANKEGWLGTGMDDIFEHRIRVDNEAIKFPFLQPAGNGFLFKKTGNYTFTLEQIMREDPLRDVMNVGLRIEKKTP